MTTDTGDDDLRLVYVTAGSRDEALRVARAAVEARLAACANILPGMTSVYHWQGAIETEEETVLILKTRAGLVPALTAAIKAAHSYDVPCVIALPVDGDAGNPDYLTWLRTEASGQE